MLCTESNEASIIKKYQLGHFVPEIVAFIPSVARGVW